MAPVQLRRPLPRAGHQRRRGAALRLAAGALAALIGAALLVGPVAHAQQDGEGGRYVQLIDAELAIDNVTSRFISRSLNSSDARGAELAVIRLDTPGGLVTSTRDIVEEIFTAPVPVVVYVAPEGARAASAGTFITASGGVAAMAPATNIGAASVVGGQGEDLPETLSEKVTQDALALIRSIADRRDRNAEALEETVLDARAFSATEALELDIIDVVADDLDDLLAQLDGMTVPVGAGETTLDTSDLQVREVGLSFFERILSFLSDPTIAFLLVSLGGLAIIIELLNFGTIIPGVIGVIMLILGFTGVGQLPFSWGGVVLLVLAMVFFIAEATSPGFGVFGSLGIVSLVLGGLFLVGFFGTPELPGSPSIAVNRWVLVGTAAAAGLGMAWLTREFHKAKRGGPAAYVSPYSREALVGKTACVTRRLAPRGEVEVAGEVWEARLTEGEQADEGQWVMITDVHGYRLDVERVASVTPITDRDGGHGQTEHSPSAEPPVSGDERQRRLRRSGS